jgi:hypothetical protein
MRNVCFLLLSVLALIWDGGCADRVTAEVASKNNSNIKRLVNLYAGYQLTHGWQGPHDKEALKDFVKRGGLPAKNFQMMGIDPDKLEFLFVSERDGEQFKVKYGVAGGIGSVTPIVFEKIGVGGLREVGFTTPLVEQVSDDRYNELWEKGGLPTGLTKAGLERVRPNGPGQESIVPGGTASKR